MSTIATIDLGTPNDGTGDPLRTGGIDINDNFAALNTDKLERGGYAGTAQDLEDAINLISTAGFMDLSTAQTAAGIKTFSNGVIANKVTATNSLDITDANLIVATDTVGVTTNVDDGDGNTLVFIKGVLTAVNVPVPT